jgi:hypothetical protein
VSTLGKAEVTGRIVASFLAPRLSLVSQPSSENTERLRRSPEMTPLISDENGQADAAPVPCRDVRWAGNGYVIRTVVSDFDAHGGRTWGIASAVAGKGSGEQSLARPLYGRLEEDWLLLLPGVLVGARIRGSGRRVQAGEAIAHRRP